MKNAAEVLEQIKPLLGEVLGVDLDEITPSARFEGDLGGSSIDLLDFAFRCEKQFGIRLNFQDLVLGDDLQTDENGLLTPVSLAALKTRLPFLDYSEFEDQPRKNQIGSTITAQALAHFVWEALSTQSNKLSRSVLG